MKVVLNITVNTQDFIKSLLLLDRGACGNIVPLKGNCSVDALCNVSSNGRRLLNCSCKNGFLGTGPICRSKYKINMNWQNKKLYKYITMYSV